MVYVKFKVVNVLPPKTSTYLATVHAVNNC